MCQVKVWVRQGEVDGEDDEEAEGEVDELGCAWALGGGGWAFGAHVGVGAGVF